VKPAKLRMVADELRRDYRVGERRACRVIRLHRSVYQYKSKRSDQAPLRQRIKEIAHSRVRYGYRRITVLLRREGWHVNAKRVYRLYREDGLSLRYKRPKRHKSAVHRIERQTPKTPNECWAMDFVSDALFNGKRFRALTVVDLFTRECLAIEVDQGIKGEHVASVVERLIQQRGAPKSIRVDNGPEFAGKALDLWAYSHGVALDFSRPGKPTDNAYVESFNGRFREECLNANWFLSLPDARKKIAAWRDEYNERRPHTSLGFKAPAEYARQFRLSAVAQMS
jgi:putative transposase